MPSLAARCAVDDDLIEAGLNSRCQARATAKFKAGEGDNVGVRISSHNKDADKEFWEHACVITSKDLNLTKAHARYLESRLIKVIAREGRATLANRSDPGFELLPEVDLADMDDFIVRLQILLPVLGADFVRPTPQVQSAKSSELPKNFPIEATENGSTVPQ